jgi:hypothetical protein
MRTVGPANKVVFNFNFTDHLRDVCMPEFMGIDNRADRNRLIADLQAAAAELPSNYLTAQKVNQVSTDAKTDSKNKWKDKNWHHIVGSYDGVKMRVYIDGVKSDSLEADITSISTNSSFIFGHDNSWASNNYFEGKLDDIGIWNRALTESEVTALFNANICIEKISVTDTLIINVNRTGFSPISFENTLKVYPNPTKDKITIDNGNLSKMNGYSIKIMNSLGQQVFLSTVNQQLFNIDITNWGGNGMYFLQLI